MNPQPKGSGAGQRGQSLVELTIMLPLLLTILLGVVDFARVFYTQIAMSNAARVGAEYAIYSYRPVDTTDYGVLRKIIDEAAGFVELEAGEISVTRSAASWDSSKTVVTVEINHPFTPIAPYTSSFWGGGTLDLRASASSRQVR